MENENLKPVQELTPFTKMIMTIGVLPTSFYSSMSYYESMVWLYEYLKNQVIPTVNNNAEAVEELQAKYIEFTGDINDEVSDFKEYINGKVEELETYMNNYFENLDVQQEINNKLDEMALDGTLTNLIKDYVDPIYSSYEDRIDTEVGVLTNKVESLASGSPLVASSTSEMTETDRVYVNTTDGKWYYYDGDSWEIGGTYQAAEDSDTVEYIDNLVENSYKTIMNIDTIVHVGLLYNNGTETDQYTNYRTTDFIPVKQGEVYAYSLYNAAHAANGAIICLYDTDKTFVSAVNAQSSQQTGEYTPSQNGYIKCCYVVDTLHTTHYMYNKTIFPTAIDKRITDEDTLLKSYSDDNYINNYKKVYSIFTESLTNAYLDTHGVPQSNAIYRVSPFIPVKAGDTIDYKLSCGSTLFPILAFYNTSKEYNDDHSIKLDTTYYKEGTFTASADGFIRYSYHNSYNDVYIRFTNYIPQNVEYYLKNTISINEVPKLNILCLGDSIFGEDNNIVDNLKKFSGANVINGAVSGTRASDRGDSAGRNYRWFDGINLITALCTNTWTNQDTAAENMATDYPWITAKLTLLKSIDMSSINMITFNWGVNDYTGGISLSDIISAQNTIINTIQQYYPAIRIIILTPTWRYMNTPADNENGDNYEFNDATLKEIAQAIYNNAQDKRISVFDAYKNLPFNYATASTYFNANSGVHPNATGDKLYAHYLNGFINSIN